MLLAAVVLSILVYGVISSMLGSLLPALGFTGDQTGTLALAQAIGLTLAALSAGPFIDIRGRKTAMVAGLAAMATALWLLPNANGDFRFAAALWFLLGLGGGVMGTASNSLLSDIGGARRASMLNMGNLFFGLGLMITPFLASNIFASDVRGLCYFAAVLVTATLIVHASIRVPLPSRDKPFRLREAAALLRSPSLRLFAAVAFLYVACEVGTSNWLVKYLIAKGVAREHALKIMSLGFAFGLLSGRVAASWILVRVSAPKVVVGSAVLTTITTFWMLHAGSGELATAAAVYCVGLSMGPVFPTTLGLTGDAFPNATGTAMGVVITAGWAGLAVSSRLIGVIAGKDESNLSNALLLFPIFSLAMIVASLAMWKTTRVQIR